MYPLLKQLLLPPASLLVLTIVGLVLMRRRPRLGRILAGIGLAALYGLSTPLCGVWLLAGLEDRALRGSPPPAAGKAQAIVILSAGLARTAPEFGGVTVDGLTLQRLRYGAKLGRETGLPIVVSGGAWLDSTTPVADFMAETLTTEFAMPMVWTESGSSSTFENARLTSELLRTRRLETALLVTHGWHMPRAADAFRHFGIDVIPAGTGYSHRGPFMAELVLPSAKGLRDSSWALHEILGRVWYWLAYYR
ncbi:MAG: YdcF family protein [Alphaproteobacteria bacterium]|jgi:uncharacterized SAM-binding protein YcdF (DUF218 family)|nr:YdcF family protein [Alphaproteobacteria bacterium]MDP6516169.1 YdcF family protein [Alphaproteobacteria bacterium]